MQKLKKVIIVPLLKILELQCTKFDHSYAFFNDWKSSFEKMSFDQFIGQSLKFYFNVFP